MAVVLLMLCVFVIIGGFYIVLNELRLGAEYASTRCFVGRRGLHRLCRPLDVARSLAGRSSRS